MASGAVRTAEANGVVGVRVGRGVRVRVGKWAMIRGGSGPRELQASRVRSRITAKGNGKISFWASFKK